MNPNLDTYPDSSKRAAWAATGLAAYGHLTGQDDPAHLTDPDTLTEIAGDYLGDLAHLLAAHGVDIPALLERARGYFQQERAEQAGDAKKPGPDLRRRTASTLAAIRHALDCPASSPSERLEHIGALIDRHRWGQNSDPWLTGGTEPAPDPDAVWADIIARLTER